MRYAEPLSNQVLIFISSIGPGIILGLLYDVISAFFGKLSKKSAFVIAGDIIFGITATLISFFYMVIYNNGIVRLNIIVAQVIGAVAFHYTLGRYVVRVVGFISMIIGKTVATVSYPAILLFGKMRKLCGNINVKKPIFKKKDTTANSEAT